MSALGRIWRGLLGLGAHKLGSKMQKTFGRITDKSMPDLERFYAQRCNSRIRANLREAKAFLATGFAAMRECNKAQALAALRGADSHFRAAEVQAEQCAVQKKGMNQATWNKFCDDYTSQADKLAQRVLGPCRKR